jgi:hypothetical protein
MAPPTERCVFVSGGWSVLGAAAVRIDFAHDRGRVTLDLPADVSPARVRVRGQGVMDFVAIVRRQRCWWHPGSPTVRVVVRRGIMPGTVR